MRTLRHPILALFGATLFLFLGTVDAFGVGACAHHAQHEDGGHGHAGESEARAAHSDHPTDELAGHRTDHDHAGPLDHETGSAESAAADSDATSECECGFLCCGASGASSFQLLNAVAAVELAPAVQVAGGLAPGRQTPGPRAPLAHAQPYPLGPPSHA